MGLILFLGPEIKGAKRWLELGPFSLQPSEFVKPAFVVLTAWLFNEAQKRRDVPGIELAVALYVVFAVLLIMQPDFGQTLLVTLVWGALVFMAGINLVWIGALGLAGAVGIVSAYFLAPHVASRIDRFLDPASGDTYQTDRSLESFLHGGWFGRGPGEGTVKDVLPDSHTDFIFAVAAEEYGLIACLVLVALFAFIVLRGLSKASQEPDGFIRHAIAGLVMLFGLQALINMAVNVGMLPAKGMTLALHLLWRLVAARHGAHHGLCAGLDAQAADGRAIEAKSSGRARGRASEREGEGGMSAASDPARRRRHRGPSLPRRGARAGACPARLRGRARDRHPRRAIWRRFPGARHPPHSLGHHHQPQPGRHGQDLLAARRRLSRALCVC